MEYKVYMGDMRIEVVECRGFQKFGVGFGGSL